MQMEISTKGIGRMIKQMVKEFSSILRMQDMKENGLMICSTDMERSNGTTVLQSIRVSFSKGRKMEVGDLTGKMGVIMRDNLFTGNFKATGPITLLTLIKPIKGNSARVIWRVAVSSHGAMEEDMRVISKMERRTGKALSSGQMETSMLEAGETGNSKASGFGLPMRTKVEANRQSQRDKANG